MIGNYGRNAYGGRAGGGKNNKNIHTISPKGGVLKRAVITGSLEKPKQIGVSKRSQSIGSVIKPIHSTGVSRRSQSNGVSNRS